MILSYDIEHYHGAESRSGGETSDVALVIQLGENNHYYGQRVVMRYQVNKDGIRSAQMMFPSDRPPVFSMLTQIMDVTRQP